MADYLTNTTELTAVADAIRAKGGTTASLVYPNGFVRAIENISSGGGGGTSLETVSITIDMSGISGADYFFDIAGTQLDGDVLTYFADRIDDTNVTITFDVVIGTNVTILSDSSPDIWYCNVKDGNVEDLYNSNYYVGCVRGADAIYIVD